MNAEGPIGSKTQAAALVEAILVVFKIGSPCNP